MAIDRIDIDELNLRIPGLSRDQRQSLGAALSRELENRVIGEAHRTGRLDRIDLKMDLDGLSVDSMAKRIADRISEALR